MIYLGRRLARRVPRLALHEQHPRRPDQSRSPHARAARASSARTPPTSCSPTTPGRRSSTCKYGPDGSLFMIDWYDKNQCHHNDVERPRPHQRPHLQGQLRQTPARAGRISPSEAARTLVALQSSPNEWYARHARRILQERGPNAEAEPACSATLGARPRDQPAVALRILLAQHAVGGLSDAGAIEQALADPDADDPRLDHSARDESRGLLPAPILAKFAELARTDPSPIVRLYLASAPAASAARTALGHPGRPGRPCRGCLRSQPAAHVLVRRRAAGRGRRARGPPRLAASSPISRIQEFMARRIAALGTPESLALLVDELGRAAGSARRARALDRDRAKRCAVAARCAMPAAWPRRLRSPGVRRRRATFARERSPWR